MMSNPAWVELGILFIWLSLALHMVASPSSWISFTRRSGSPDDSAIHERVIRTIGIFGLVGAFVPLALILRRVTDWVGVAMLLSAFGSVLVTLGVGLSMRKRWPSIFSSWQSWGDFDQPYLNLAAVGYSGIFMFFSGGFKFLTQQASDKTPRWECASSAPCAGGRS